MKFLYYFAETNSYMHKWQRIHIFDELERHSIEIEVFNPNSFNSTEQANVELCNYIKQNATQFDLFMTCVGSDLINNTSIDVIRQLGLPSLLICFDNLHAPYMHKSIAKQFDLVWLTSKETINLFKAWGCKNIIFQTYASNPYNFQPNWADIDNSICFVGTPYGGRINKLNFISQSQIRCKIYSDSLQRESKSETVKIKNDYQKLISNGLNLLTFDIGRKVVMGAIKNKFLLNKNSSLDYSEYLKILPSLSFSDMQYVYSNSSLSLNVTELRNTYVLKKPVHKIHLRTFEIPMSGGLQISSYSDELASYYQEDSEIVLYKSNEELIDKSNFYLNPNNQSIVKSMKNKARLRSELEHTWMNRFNKVITFFNLQ